MKANEAKAIVGAIRGAAVIIVGCAFGIAIPEALGGIVSLILVLWGLILIESAYNSLSV